MTSEFKQTTIGPAPKTWDVANLSDVADPRIRWSFTGGPFGSNLKSSDYVARGVRIIQLQNIGDGNFKNDYEIFTSPEKADELISCNIYPGEIILSKMGDPVARACIIPPIHDRYLMCSDGIRLAVDQNKFDTYFVFTQINAESFRKSAANAGTGSTRKRIGLTELRALQLLCPPIQEQRAIALTLRDVDTLLDSLHSLIGKKTNLKQAAMQQLLSGKVRLPGFTGDCKVRKLGDVGKCLRGVTYQGDSDLSTHDTSSTKRLLRSNNIKNAVVNIHDIQFVNAKKVSAQQILKKDDVLICMANGSKALVGKAGLFNINDGYEYTFGSFMACFRSIYTEANPKFIFYLFQTGLYRNYINNLLAGSSINNLKPSSIESLAFSMPELPEQDAIAEILTDMDIEVASLEALRSKTFNLKQGMMQELLTGKTRLI
ncbi:restriction endonuclease subunit S [Polynucleobacter sp. AP-Melu-500A-A1]|uniref:restriction endonuclease subunit S n=1 Tax=Polynucleobacter sp. AP-Melu-500A-A1 TaxID=2576929 RepID=UPI001C0CD5EC|nr:restriction endonuclease subunit S [Polynucleobacter sp. AP-Melu-500A-A1]MBU3631141.1 restriction endonuclease subunit S [Polynucleobacter sp. AP-Melu-500A-A1]